MEPDIKLLRLPVTNGHELQLYETGAADGLPVILLHGGPGSGFNPKRLALFDLTKIRLIGFDQRGCGLSTPGGLDGLNDNTTQHLVEDIEAIRLHLQIEGLIVCGSSWGTSLAVEYAKRYPQDVAQLLLISTFLARKQDQDWSFDGVASFFPDAYSQLVEGFPADIDPAAYLYSEIMSGEPARMREAAYRFNQYGCTCFTLHPKTLNRDDMTEQDINSARILLHYAMNDFHLNPVLGILENIEAIKDIPVSMIHGRYDMDCLPATAYELASRLPLAKLDYVMGNHFPSDPVYGEAIRGFIESELA